MSSKKSALDFFSEPIDFSYMPPHIADDIYLVAVECAKDVLACYGFSDERALRAASEAADLFFIGKHGLNCSWLEDSNKVDNFDIVTAIETKEVAERIAEGAEMEGLTMVDWMVRAINRQFVEDSVAKGEREGQIVWTGEYRDRKPVFVSAEIFRKAVN